MALVVKRTMELYRHLNFEITDKRTSHLPLLYSPIPVIFLLVAYLLFVFKIGPKYMKNRKPFKLKEILIGYNALQMIFNFYLVMSAFPIAYREYNWFCEPIAYGYSESQLKIVFLGWIYFVIKCTDLLDTVFFVLRKKSNQVTFLHVYHHTLMVSMSWVFAKYFSGGHSVMLGLFNCAVHVVMYGYYLLTAMSDDFKKDPWWKKYITQLQLFQFMCVYVVYVPMIFMPSCGYPKSLLWLFIPQNTLMVYLFGNFYYKSYIKKANK